MNEEQFLKENVSDLLEMEKSSKLADLLDKIKSYVQTNSEAITTSQLRNIFAKVQRVENENSLQLLRPKLAYVAARQGKPEAKRMVEFFDFLISKVSNKEQLKGFKTFFESVVAYHKYFNPKNN